MPNYYVNIYYVPDELKDSFNKGNVDNSKIFENNADILLCCHNCFERTTKDYDYDYKTSIILYSDEEPYGCRETLGYYLQDVNFNPHLYYIVSWDYGVPVSDEVINFINNNFTIQYNPQKRILYGKCNEFKISELSLALYMLVNTPIDYSDSIEIYKLALLSIYKEDDYGDDYNDPIQSLTNAYAIDLIQRGKASIVFEDRSGNGISSSIERMLADAFAHDDSGAIKDYIDFSKKYGLDLDSLPTFNCYGTYDNYLTYKGDNTNE